LEGLRVFGCVAYATGTRPYLHKLDDRSTRLIYIGNEPGTKGFRLFNPRLKKIVVCRDAEFNEELGWKYVAGSETHELNPGMFVIEWHGSIDTGCGFVNPGVTDEVEAEDQEAENQHDADDNQPAGNDPDPDPVPVPVTETQSLLRRSSRVSTKPTRFNDFIMGSSSRTSVVNEDQNLLLIEDDEPRTFQEAKVSSKWMFAMDQEIESIEKNDSWELVEAPDNVNPIGLKWVFKIKRNPDGSINKFKARLVAKGYAQKEGIDYDEVFAPVARIETVRLLISLAAKEAWELHHLDVKSASLHGELKEQVFVTQPEGFVKKGEERKIYKLKKALYGLKQAPRAWNTKLDRELKQMSFKRCQHEQAVYVKKTNKSILIIVVYVDDLLVTGSKLGEIGEFKKQMQERFDMSDLGKLSYYLGIEVKQEDSSISISQVGYAKKILKDAGMHEANPTQCPLEPGMKLSMDKEGKPVDATLYRRRIGCLRYLLHTRPDLSYSVGLVSRYMQEPKESHMAAVKQILRYIQGSLNFGVRYNQEKTKELVGFSDSSFAMDQDDGRSTTGHVFYLGKSPITWCSQKQNTVALSSCEAEFMAATSAACQGIWLRGLLSEITGMEERVVVLFVDKKSAIALMKNPVFHGRSKHINTRYHFIRECVERGQVQVEFVRGDLQRADILTKALARIKFKEMQELLGVEDLSISSQKLGG
jgi:hypothetical protein